MTAGYAGLMAALAVTLGLIYLALKIIRRVQVGRTSGGTTEVPLKLVQRIPIGPRQGVGLLQAGDRLLVISIAESGARLLTELEGGGPVDLAGATAGHSLDTPGEAGAGRSANRVRNPFSAFLSRFEARNVAGQADLAPAVRIDTALAAARQIHSIDPAETNDGVTIPGVTAPAPHPGSERLVWTGRRGRIRLDEGPAAPEAPAAAPAAPAADRRPAGGTPKKTPQPASRSVVWKSRPGPVFQLGRKLGWAGVVVFLPLALLLALAPAAVAQKPLAPGRHLASDNGPDETVGINVQAVRTDGLLRAPSAEADSTFVAALLHLTALPAGLVVSRPFDAKLRPAANASTFNANAANAPALNANGASPTGRIDPATLIARAKARVAASSGRSPLAAAARSSRAGSGSSGVAAASFAPGFPGTLPSVGPPMDLTIGNGNNALHLSGAVGMVVFLGALTLLPALLLLMTSFTRILIVLQFLRPAIGTQSAPPVQLLVALSLLLTGVVMNPVLQQANRDAIQPYMNHSISETEALNRGLAPFRGFMLRNINEKDLGMFVEMSGDAGRIDSPEQVGTLTLASAFVTSELRTAFQMGFLIFIPFIIVDLIVASVLMSLGMFMLPPLMVSLPFKLLLFVLADGWSLVVKNLVLSFR